MKSQFLFPHKWRIPGLGLFLIGFVLYLFSSSSSDPIGAWHLSHPLVLGIDSQILVNDIEYLLLIIGLLLIAFSKEVIEDEQIAQLRLDSLQWAIYANYGILIACVLFINGSPFLTVVCYNVLSPIIFFIIRFRWKIRQLNRSLKLSQS